MMCSATSSLVQIDVELTLSVKKPSPVVERACRQILIRTIGRRSKSKRIGMADCELIHTSLLGIHEQRPYLLALYAQE